MECGLSEKMSLVSLSVLTNVREYLLKVCVACPCSPSTLELRQDHEVMTSVGNLVRFCLKKRVEG